MSIGDILKDIGGGLATGVKRVGEASIPILQRTAQVVSGETPQIDEENRQQQTQLDDAALNAKADELEAQLAMGRKYGTLTPEGQQQYVDQITNLFSHPKHMNSLMTRLQRAIHPNGATYQANEPLPNATPQGGTAAADVELANRREKSHPIPGVKPFKGPDGQWYQPMYDAHGHVENELVPGYTPPPQSGAGKSPPLTGDKLPSDAVGADGNPIPQEDRNAGKSFVEFHGQWWPVAKPKPVMRPVGGHLLLLDPYTGAKIRDLGSTQSAKISYRQTLQPGDDGQMHLVTLTTVTTPEGAKIDVQPDESEGTSTGGAAKPSAPSSAPKTPAKRVGSILPKTGAKATPQRGAPVVPGLSMLAHSKNPLWRDQTAEYAKMDKQARDDQQLADFYTKEMNTPGNKSAMDTSLITDFTGILAKGGRKTQAEIKFAQQLGGLGMRADNAWQRLRTGELTPEMRKLYVQYLSDRAAEERREADSFYQQLNSSPAASSSDSKVDDFLKNFK